MDNPTVITAIRTVHILCTVFWVMASTLMTLFVMPVLSVNRDGRAAYDRILAKLGLSVILTITSPLGTLTGIWLFVTLHGFTLDSLGQMVLAAGAVAGLLAFVSGILFIAPQGVKIQRLGKQLAVTEAAARTAATAE